jgi:hypothetical protein
LNIENEYSRNNVAQSPIVNESTSRDIEYLDLTSEESRLNSPPKSRKNSDSNETSNNETMSPEPRRSQRPKTKTKFFGIFHLKGGDL